MSLTASATPGTLADGATASGTPAYSPVRTRMQLMPAAAAPATSLSGRSPTNSASPGPTPSPARAARKGTGWGLRYCPPSSSERTTTSKASLRSRAASLDRWMPGSPSVTRPMGQRARSCASANRDAGKARQAPGSVGPEGLDQGLDRHTGPPHPLQGPVDDPAPVGAFRGNLTEG